MDRLKSVPASVLVAVAEVSEAMSSQLELASALEEHYTQIEGIYKSWGTDVAVFRRKIATKEAVKFPGR